MENKAKGILRNRYQLQHKWIFSGSCVARVNSQIVNDWDEKHPFAANSLQLSTRDRSVRISSAQLNSNFLCQSTMKKRKISKPIRLMTLLMDFRMQIYIDCVLNFLAVFRSPYFAHFIHHAAIIYIINNCYILDCFLNYTNTHSFVSLRSRSLIFLVFIPSILFFFFDLCCVCSPYGLLIVVLSTILCCMISPIQSSSWLNSMRWISSRRIPSSSSSSITSSCYVRSCCESIENNSLYSAGNT